MCVPQGEQGLQGPPGPFEYVDPPEDLYIKGEKVGFTVPAGLLYLFRKPSLQCSSSAGSCCTECGLETLASAGTNFGLCWFFRVLKALKASVDFKVCR